MVTAPDPVLDTLVAARAVITDPAHWTRGAFARDVDGEPVPPGYSVAVCWCAEGACCLVSLDGATRDEAVDALSAVAGRTIAVVNDVEGHVAVLAAFDAAIAARQATS